MQNAVAFERQLQSTSGLKLNYEPALDGLRACALISVMGFHFAEPLMTGGAFGVDVFFVLSGWLITSILMGEAKATGAIDYPAFLLRRTRRLLPALAVLLLAYAVLAPTLWPKLAERRWQDIGASAFYVTNLRETFWPADTPLSHTWSLAIEEQFYLLWPLALTALLRLPRRTAALVLMSAWAILSLGRIGLLPPGSPVAYYFTPLHATGLLLGSALAIHPVSTRLGRVALAALAALLIGGHTQATFGYLAPLAEILTAMVIAHPPKLLTAAPLRFVGRISYGVYLWHIPLAWALGFPGSFGELGVLMALSLLAGWLSHVSVERWCLKGLPLRPALTALSRQRPFRLASE